MSPIEVPTDEIKIEFNDILYWYAQDSDIPITLRIWNYDIRKEDRIILHPWTLDCCIDENSSVLLDQSKCVNPNVCSVVFPYRGINYENCLSKYFQFSFIDADNCCLATSLPFRFLSKYEPSPPSIFVELVEMLNFVMTESFTGLNMDFLHWLPHEIIRANNSHLMTSPSYYHRYPYNSYAFTPINGYEEFPNKDKNHIITSGGIKEVSSDFSIALTTISKQSDCKSEQTSLPIVNDHSNETESKISSSQPTKQLPHAPISKKYNIRKTSRARNISAIYNPQNNKKYTKNVRKNKGKKTYKKR